MSRAVIWLLLIFGILLLILGLGFRNTPMWVIGLLMIAGGFYLGLRPGGILRKEQVIDNWSILIEDGHGKAEEIFQNTEDFIRASKAPALKIERRQMSPGFLRAILGAWRDFLVVTEQGNPRLNPYQLFQNARDYGNNLDVSWYLTYRPSLLEAILSLIPGVTPRGLNLDLFDQQDLRAYVTNAHHCLLKAVEKLMVGLNQDPSKIDRKSRGFLGIS